MLHIIGGRLIDGTGEGPFNGAVAIEGNRFVGVGTASDPSPGSTVVDARGRYVLPGLISAHTHLAWGYGLDPDAVSVAEVAAWAFEHMRRCIALGITTVRETGGADGGLADVVENGLAVGPRIIPSGPALIQTGGHCDFRPRFAHESQAHHLQTPGLSRLTEVVDGVDEMRVAARTAFARGAKFLKLMVSGGVTSVNDSLDDTQFASDEIRAAVDEANARGSYVTAHVHNNEAIMLGLGAGVRCFEHASFLDEKTAEAIAAHDARIVFTLAIVDVYERLEWLSDDVRRRAQGVGTSMRAAIRLAEKYGILFGCGADLIGPDQRDFGLEFALQAQVLGAPRAFRTLTLDNARVLGIDHELGSIQVGKIADLVVVDGNPLEHPEILNDPSHIHLVYKNGVLVGGSQFYF